ncbi:MAG: CaiB/BaiF CoA-transferase family protein, partial [bacterium]|nr:CaiB/BaiF CoA-transferase family protein [bacterium]
MLPLAGVRVVDFTHFVAGPHCTLWLANMGAEVYKIESPARPDAFRLSQLKPGIEATLNNSAIFVATNLLKKSVCVDVATAEGQQICHDLVAASDVVVANFRPGVLEQFNLDYETLKTINPGLVMAVISGYGYSGDYAAFQALAPNIHAFSGISAATGYPGGPPEQFFSTYADVIAGQAATLSILGALVERRSTGVGAFIDIAMSETMISVAPEAALRAAVLGSPTPRSGNEEPGVAPHGCYPCAADDRWIAIAAFNDAQWKAMLGVLDLADLDADPRFATIESRWENRIDLDIAIAQATRSHDAHELSAELQTAGVASSPVRTAEDVLSDPQLVADDFLAPVVHNELGEAVLPKMPWRIAVDGVVERPIGPAPDFGSNTSEVLGSVLGIPHEQLESLRERKIIA